MSRLSEVLAQAKNENRAMMFYYVASGVVPGVALIGWLAVFLKLL